MKTLVFLIAFLFSTAILANDPWTQGDITRETIWQTLNLLDWAQTRTIATETMSVPGFGTFPRYSEGNPFLGNHPTRKDVDRYMAASALFHLGVSHILPTRWRTGWQNVTIGWEASFVYRNYRAGISLTF